MIVPVYKIKYVVSTLGLSETPRKFPHVMRKSGHGLSAKADSTGTGGTNAEDPFAP